MPQWRARALDLHPSGCRRQPTQTVVMRISDRRIKVTWIPSGGRNLTRGRCKLQAIPSKSLRYILPLLSVALLSTIGACGAEEEPSPTAQPAAKAPAAKPSPTRTPENKVSTKPKQYSAPPAMTIDSEKSYTATFKMKSGAEFVSELYPKEAPKTVNSFVFLARDGFYDGVTFHRVIPGWMAQGGDPTGTGGGSPGYSFENEFSPIRRHDGPGIMSMANRGIVGGKATNGSQFFIMHTKDSPRLDGLNEDGSAKDCAKTGVSCHAVFGKVIKGMDVVDSLEKGDVIAEIAITENE